MDLAVRYDCEFNILVIGTGQKHVDGESIEDATDVVVRMGSTDGYDIVGVMILGASAVLAPHFIPRDRKCAHVAGSGQIAHYDKETDTLTLGTATTDPAMISQAGEYLTAYWKRDELDENDLNIIGVALRNAAKHLTPFFKPRDHYARRNG